MVITVNASSRPPGFMLVPLITDTRSNLRRCPLKISKRFSSVDPMALNEALQVRQYPFTKSTRKSVLSDSCLNHIIPIQCGHLEDAFHALSSVQKDNFRREIQTEHAHGMGKVLIQKRRPKKERKTVSGTENTIGSSHQSFNACGSGISHSFLLWPQCGAKTLNGGDNWATRSTRSNSRRITKKTTFGQEAEHRLLKVNGKPAVPKKLTETLASDELDNIGPFFVCPSCSKTFSPERLAVHRRSCGHLFDDRMHSKLFLQEASTLSSPMTSLKQPQKRRRKFWRNLSQWRP